MISVLILTSNAPRHLYFANRLADSFIVKGIITEPKHDYFELQRQESALVRQHFVSLGEYEKRYLGSYEDFPSSPLLKIGKQQINDEETLRWAIDQQAEVILLFGTGILGEGWLTKFKNRIINLHLGYSPRYRGSATLFWPFVHDELEYVGATIHLAEANVDGGAILEVVRPEIVPGDNYYDISCKTIRKAIDDLGAIVGKYLGGCLNPKQQVREAQKYLYRKADFKEEVLRLVLNKYGNKFTDR